MVNISNHDDHWIQKNWRPAMGWQYMIVCLFDFVIAPVLSALYAFYTDTPLVHWAPLTIQGGGLYHLAMGAVTGITSYAKSRERTELIKSPYIPDPAQVEPSDPEIK